MTSFLKSLQTWHSARLRRKSDALLALDAPRKIDRFIRWQDHGIFRDIWHNEALIAPGVWRSNHPSSRRIRMLKGRGIRTVLNLRGPGNNVTYLWEKKLCEDNDIAFHSIALDARRAPDPQPLIEVLDFLEVADRPMLFHCKSGADRAGLVAALYLYVVRGASEEDARAMLSPRFLHFKRSRTGVLDMFLDAYIRAHKLTGIAFRDWVTSRYDKDRLQARFDASR